MGLEYVRVDVVADLTAKRSPVDCMAREGATFAHLGLQPVLEAGVVDETHAATALAHRHQRIVEYVGAIPTETTENIVVLLSYDGCWSLDFLWGIGPATHLLILIVLGIFCSWCVGSIIPSL